ncbi:jg3805 [Pararge aegeria aegeria]|uniref:sphinganine-1-phosphate aldolase n=3 Tax=Pararge aegeria TaxID=116150 RepID=A0A8S4RTJ3_9NEOP|nr:jg3805 [Pararge aegeria aegeria]
MSERPLPLKAINRFFEGKEPWQIVTITASSVLAIVWTHSLYNAKESVPARLRKEFFRWLRQVPFVRRKIEEKMAEIKKDFKKDVAKRLSGMTVYRHLPKDGFTAEQVAEEIRKHLVLGSYDWKGGNVSGAVYHVNEDISRVACEAYALTAYTNPLHADVFPGINKMEAEIVRMSVNLFNGDEECCGTVTTGGTESIMMACKAFRDLAYSRGITNPQMILPATAHTAFDKAAQYLGIGIVTVPVSTETYTVDLNAVKRAIGRRTCMIVGSAPNFPYGTMDDIEALSDIAVEYDVPLHVDACLGGFIAAFMTAAGHDMPLFDFRLPGVSSISADTHKFGERMDVGVPRCWNGSPELVSAALVDPQRGGQTTLSASQVAGSKRHRTVEFGTPYKRPLSSSGRLSVDMMMMINLSTFETSRLSVCSDSTTGSRAGGLIAACWATMMFVGRARYVQMTDEIITTARYIEAEVRKIEGLFIFGKPATTVVAFGSQRFDIFKLADELHKKGWSLNTLQFPSGIHIAVTHAHTQSGVADRFIADLQSAAKICLKEGSEPVQGKMAIYGVAQSIPDRSLVSDITKHFIDSMYYLPKPEDSDE